MKNSYFKKIISLISVLCLFMGVFEEAVTATTTGYEEYTPAQWVTLESLSNIERTDDSLKLTFLTSAGTKGQLICSFPNEGGIRIRGDNEGFFSPSGNKNFTFKAEENGIYANTSDAAIRITDNYEDGWQIILYNKSGSAVMIYNKESILFGCDEKGTIKKFKTVSPVSSGEKFYGLGERFNGLFQNGKQIELWNYDSVSELKYEDGDHNVGYKNIPLLHSSAGYSIFYNTSYYGLADIGYTDGLKYSFAFDGPEMDFYIFVNGYDENMSSYLDLTGNTVIPPKWALSYWAGQTGNVWRRGTKDETTTYENVKAILERYDDLGTPIKNVYAEGCWYFESVMNYLQSRNIHVFGWSDSTWRTFDSADNPTSAADVAESAGISPSKYPLVRKNTDASSYYKQKDGAYWVDYTNSLSVDWLKARFEKPFRSGLQGMMVDYADSLGTDSLFSNLKNGSYMHNRYAYYYDKAMYEAFSDYWGKEHILFARAACAGSQHYVASFGGDQSSSFLGLRQSVSAMLSAAASGIAVWGSDIGGYGTSNDANKNDPEVYARWLQFGTFSPLMRAHGSSSRDPWSYDNTGESEERFKFYYWTRENILNYIYSNMVDASINNVSVVKSMAAAFGQCESVINNQTQYMLGNEMLVCPVTEQSARSLNIDFPSGNWYNLWNGNKVSGGKSITVSADIDTIPVYLRSGAVLPVTLNNSLQIGDAYTDESSVDAIIVTPVSEDRNVTVYGENGTSQNYTYFNDNHYGYTLKSNTANNTEMVIVYGINAERIIIDGEVLEKLTALPDGTCRGYYYDHSKNSTVISTGGEWFNLSYADDSLINDYTLQEKIEFDFTDPQITVEDIDRAFDSYYIENSQSNEYAQSTVLSSAWNIDGGYLRNNRKDNSTNSYYKNISYLTLADKRTLGFEATLDYKQAWKYHGILFGMKNPQKYVINDSEDESMFAVYVDAEGRVMLYGNYDNMPDNRVIYRLSGYSSSDDIAAETVRSITVRVINDELTVIPDNNPAVSISVRLNGYTGGFISLFSSDGSSGGFTAFRAEPIFDNVISTGFSTFDISNQEAKKYKAYQVSDLSESPTMESGAIDTLWKKNAQGYLCPTKSDEGTDYKSLIALTQAGQTYTDFEATITFQQSWKRLGIMFGTKLDEFAYTGSSSADLRSNGGVLVYVEAEGGRVAAGAVTGGKSNPEFYRNSATLSTFTDGGTGNNVSAKKVHKLNIIVLKGVLTITVDDLPESRVTVGLSQEYTGGYISLVANGTSLSGGFGSITVKDLTDNADGDVNRDGNVDIKDIVRLKKYLTDSVKADKIGILFADLDNSTFVDAIDLTALNKKIMTSN